MNGILNLEELTVDQAKTLLEKGTSTADLLGAVLRAITTKYNEETQTYAPNLELINKQSELAGLCIGEGVDLKKVVETLGVITIENISTKLIEDNLTSIIASGYNPSEILECVMDMNHHYKSHNPLNLINKLTDEYNARDILTISSEFNNSSKLLSNKGMDSNVTTDDDVPTIGADSCI